MLRGRARLTIHDGGNLLLGGGVFDSSLCLDQSSIFLFNSAISVAILSACLRISSSLCWSVMMATPLWKVSQGNDHLALKSTKKAGDVNRSKLSW
jgi:hypothetical protein